jgi:hypothetical protein
MCVICNAPIPEKQARAILTLRLGGVHKVSEYCQSCYDKLGISEKGTRKRPAKKKPWEE